MKNGKVLLTYSASATDARYCMGLLWADENSDTLDARSWHKSSAPVFASSQKNRQFGPGHSCFIRSQDDSSDLLLYHARSYHDIEGNPLYDPNPTRVWDSSSGTQRECQFLAFRLPMGRFICRVKVVELSGPNSLSVAEISETSQAQLLENLLQWRTIGP